MGAMEASWTTPSSSSSEMVESTQRMTTHSLALMANKNAKVVNIDGYEDVPPFDENALKKAVAHQPVSVAMKASGRALQLYDSGVLTGESGANLDRGVVVGWICY